MLSVFLKKINVFFGEDGTEKTSVNILFPLVSHQEKGETSTDSPLVCHLLPGLTLSQKKFTRSFYTDCYLV